MSTFYFVADASRRTKNSNNIISKELLRKGIIVYDFYNIGVPKGANKKWHQEQQYNSSVEF